MCLLFVALPALALHSCFRRFAAITAGVTFGFTVVLFALWLWFDATVPQRRWASFRLVWMGALVAMIVSTVVGALVRMGQWMERWRQNR